MSTSEALLVQQMKDGNQTAFENLFHEHYEILCRFGLKWVQDPDQVEEIVQEAFVGIWEKRDSLNITGSFRSYLFAAIRNACLNYIKHMKVRAEHQTYVQAITNPNLDSADKLLEASELQKAINKAVDELPDRCRAVFKLSREEGKKYSEIAEELDISIKTVENQMGKALKTLRIELKDYLTILILMLLNG